MCSALSLRSLEAFTSDLFTTNSLVFNQINIRLEFDMFLNTPSYGGSVFVAANLSPHFCELQRAEVWLLIMTEHHALTWHSHPGPYCTIALGLTHSVFRKKLLKLCVKVNAGGRTANTACAFKFFLTFSQCQQGLNLKTTQRKNEMGILYTVAVCQLAAAQTED